MLKHTYQGADIMDYVSAEKQENSEDIQYVIVPVDNAGSHEVEVESSLYGFDADTARAPFQILSDPVYALQVAEMSAASKVREKNHLVKPGDVFAFEVTAKTDDTVGTDTVQTEIYRYNGRSYEKIDWTLVLQGEQTISAGQNKSWKPTVSENAEKGVYRLQFTYHDKTEYWDFMVEK